MTERFVVDDDYNWVDTVTDEWIDDEKLFDLANEIYDENEQLKVENKVLKDKNASLWAYITDLHEQYEEAHGMDIRNSEWYE